MVPILVTNWWSPLIRGLLAIVLALVAFTLPGITFGDVVLLFGAYAFIDGVVSLAGAWRAARAHERWGALVFEGVAGIAAAVITVVLPALTALVLVYIVAGWALVTGVLEIAAAIKLRKHIAGEWLLALSGVVSILFGLVAAVVPLAGAFANRDLPRHLYDVLWDFDGGSGFPAPALAQRFEWIGDSFADCLTSAVVWAKAEIVF